MQRNIIYKRFFKKIAVIICFCWFVILVLFFVNPSKNEQLIHRAYNLMTGKQFHVIQKPLTCYIDSTHAWQMNDDVKAYWKHSRETGIGQQLRYSTDIDIAVRKGKLIPVVPTELYLVDSMRYSFPFALPHVVAFLDTLANRFQAKLTNTDLYGSQFVITSVLRTEHSVKLLKKFNRNAIKNSAHLHGTTFDVSYATFFQKKPLTEAQSVYLKEVLALCLFDLRKEKKCWVKYELFQTCFHVVVRKPIS